MKYDVILFGAGKQLERIYKYVECSVINICEIWDNDETKNGLLFDGIAIAKPRRKLSMDKFQIVITSPVYYKEIKEQLISEYGFLEDEIHDVMWIYSLRMSRYYSSNIIDGEEKKAFDRILECGLETYNVDMDESHTEELIAYGVENDKGYVIHNGYKMFFPSRYKRENALSYYRGLRREQNINSPHCYANFILDDDFDCVVDAGCCEGIFSLDMVSKTKTLILIEPQKDWTLLYDKTFEKMEINVCNKFLSAEDNEYCTTLDSLLGEYIEKTGKKILIKMDIEGAEIDALNGAKKILNSNNNITLVICAYHHAKDSEVIIDILNRHGYLTKSSKRNMFFRPENEENTVNPSIEWKENLDENYRLRIGLIAGYKRSEEDVNTSV